MHPDIHAHRLLILDFGSQYTQLIARRVREVGVYSEIHPWDMAQDDIRAFQPSGIILSGGPESVNLDDPPRAPQGLCQAPPPKPLRERGVPRGQRQQPEVDRAPDREGVARRLG